MAFANFPSDDMESLTQQIMRLSLSEVKELERLLKSHGVDFYVRVGAKPELENKAYDRYTVRVKSFNPGNKICVIKVARETTRDGLKQTKDDVELGRHLGQGMTFLLEDAKAFARRLNKAGADTAIDIVQ